jgi:hypothetical protein
MAEQLRGQFEKFVVSSYYSESELCGGAVTVSFSNKVSPRTFQTALVFRAEKLTEVIRFREGDGWTHRRVADEFNKSSSYK